jgi:hypothetical protein
VVPPGLEDDAQSRAPRLVAVVRVDAQDPDLAGRPRAEALQDLDGGGLAGTVRAEQGEHLAPVQPEVDAVEHVDRAVSHS